jgi:UrcA family protein
MEFRILSLGSIAMAGYLLMAAAVSSGVVPPEAPNADLLVPLHVVEPARWLVEKPGTERWEEESIRVSYSELDLSKAAGVSDLYERLRRASERVCRQSVRVQRSGNSEERLCISGVLAKAVSEVDHRSLDKIHSG